MVDSEQSHALSSPCNFLAGSCTASCATAPLLSPQMRCKDSCQGSTKATVEFVIGVTLDFEAHIYGVATRSNKEKLDTNRVDATVPVPVVDCASAQRLEPDRSFSVACGWRSAGSGPAMGLRSDSAVDTLPCINDDGAARTDRPDRVRKAAQDRRMSPRAHARARSQNNSATRPSAARSRTRGRARPS
jgi:hypothetical protein